MNWESLESHTFRVQSIWHHSGQTKANTIWWSTHFSSITKKFTRVTNTLQLLEEFTSCWVFLQSRLSSRSIWTTWSETKSQQQVALWAQSKTSRKCWSSVTTITFNATLKLILSTSLTKRSTGLKRRDPFSESSSTSLTGPSKTDSTSDRLLQCVIDL